MKTTPNSTDAASFRSWADIDLGRLRSNLRTVREQAGTEIMAAVKADAYGHGAVEISQALAAAGDGLAPERFGVATPAEALELRAAGIDRPIHLIGALLDEEIHAAVEAKAVVTVHDLEQVRALNEAAANSPLSVQVNLDTGMGRLGCLPDALPGIVDAIVAAPHLEFGGLWSHFATGEQADCPNTALQIASLRDAADSLRARGTAVPMVHIANSAGLAIQPVVGFSPARPGIALYGLHPGPDTESALDLAPVLSWKSRLILIKDLPAGSTIGYGRTFELEAPSRIGTVPVGYADGYSRLLSSRAEVLVGGRRVPVVGVVSMDYFTVLLDDVPNASMGDEVVLIGMQGDETIGASEAAGWMDTIHYEVTCLIGARVRRIYRDES